MRRSIPLLILLILIPLGLDAQLLRWTSTGGPPGGFVYTMVSDPNGTIYASSGTRVFSSSDRGRSWQPTDRFGDRDQYVYALASDSSGVIYAGGHQTNVTDVLQRYDREAWESIPIGNTSAGALAISRMGTLFAGSPRGMLLRSTNGGGSWESTAVSDVFIRSLTALPGGVILAMGSRRG
jgi:hypothetical protein